MDQKPIKYTPLGEPIVIDGQEVIVFRDVLGAESTRKGGEKEVFTVIEPASPSGRPAILIDENELNRMREDYPGIKVYGLWQILFHNDKVTLGSEVVVYPLDYNEGAYIRLDRNRDLYNASSIISSGEYKDNFISELAGVVDFVLAEDAVQLEADLSQLKLPKTPAFTRPELHAKHRHEEMRRWFVVGIFALIVLVVAGIVNGKLYNNYKVKMAEYHSRKTLINDLENRASGLRRERLAVLPNNGLVLDRLLAIFRLDPKATTPLVGNKVTSFATEHRLVTSPNLTLDIGKAVDGVTSELNNRMAFDLIVSPDPVIKGERN
jgi:hypothetical protein